MNRIRVWGLSAAAVVGLGGPAVAADPPPPTTLANKLFGPKPKPPGPAAKDGTSLRPPTVTAPLPPDVLAHALQAEQEAWNRRMDVCVKLREAGVAKNDEALVRQADELERQATALYDQRVTALGVPRVKSPLPVKSPAETLDKELGTGVAVNPLTATNPKAPATGTAALKAPAPPTPSPDDVREVKP